MPPFPSDHVPSVLTQSSDHLNQTPQEPNLFNAACNFVQQTFAHPDARARQTAAIADVSSSVGCKPYLIVSSIIRKRPAPKPRLPPAPVCCSAWRLRSDRRSSQYRWR